MKKKIAVIITILLLLLVVGMLILNTKKTEGNNKFTVVTTFYPIYIMTSNIMNGAENVELTNLAEQNVGCVHNYTLSTLDMKKISGSNVLVKNGLGLENYIDKALSSNNNIKVIDSSKSVEDLLKDNEEINPHIWTSIDKYISQVTEINRMLKEYNSVNADVYEKNTKEYIEKLEVLKKEYEQELKKLEGRKVICLDEALGYLAKEIGMDFTVVETGHEESSLSAESVKNIVDKIKQEKISVIFVSNEEIPDIAQILEKETGAKIYKLNTGLKGDNNNNAYIKCMEENLNVLKSIDE